ncbi:TIGR03915 family putative DNA repair protein [Flavisolibacter nicotianae]|uniref:TIGR03915 family putative DNA repair protein n=1 Tax=Flavisolibacter nicotianae TaxID=2364882 RepID=UPI000EB52C59|nr:TIGR03915 family putative DNA repair protein [Flavisolibacter nicotianae]
MQTIVYNGSFEGFLCAVFDVYEYKFTDVDIVPAHRHQPSLFAEPHIANPDLRHSDRVWKGLQKKLTHEAQDQLQRAFLSELDGIENTLLQYIQYVFSSDAFVEEDYSHTAVVSVVQTAKKVWREKHRMEAFVQFQRTTDDLYYAIIEPDYNVLPLIAEHFKTRYQHQRWMIYDGRRRYGLYYDLNTVSTVQIQFSETTSGGKDVSPVYDETEVIYQQLWKQYFKGVNIAARKNTKLHIQHMPRRYWKYLPEKSPFTGGNLQDRLTNWTYRRA